MRGRVQLDACGAGALFVVVVVGLLLVRRLFTSALRGAGAREAVAVEALEEEAGRAGGCRSCGDERGAEGVAGGAEGEDVDGVEEVVAGQV